MPTFSAIQLDRFLEPGDSKTTSSAVAAKKKQLLDPSFTPRLERRKTTSLPIDDLKSSWKRLDIPQPHPQLRRPNSTTTVRHQISPALYATPEPAPLPDDSPTSSFPPPSPYLITHKRRGPRLLKSFSHHNVAAATVENEGDASLELKRERFDEELVSGEVVAQEAHVNGGLLAENGEVKAVIGSSSERDAGENEDFFDPQESMSFSSVADEDFGGELSARANTPMGVFYDAREELSSDSGRQGQRSLSDVETELREMRLSMFMEIEKRKQAEEVLNSMRSQWQMLKEKLGAVGLSLPTDLSALAEDSQSDIGATEEICRQIHLARFVSESIGRGIAKAEAEAEMEAQLEIKNFEIARLCDRLHYYETMNREMCQRNQEAVEIARCARQKRMRRQKWIWSSIAAAITLGSAALLWSYLPSGKDSSSTKYLEPSDPESDMQ